MTSVEAASRSGELASGFFFLTIILLASKGNTTSLRHFFVHLWATRVSLAMFLSHFTNAALREQRPLIGLFFIGLLIIFLFESVKLWIKTGIVSKSVVSFFPRYYPCNDNFVWPIGKQFDEHREFLKSAGFVEDIQLQFGNDDEAKMFTSVMYSADKNIRLLVTFGTIRGKTHMFCLIRSDTTTGKSILTTNQSLILAASPKLWEMKRYPMVPIKKLLEIHKSRIANEMIAQFQNTNTLEELNLEQFQFETENCNAGYFERTEDNKVVMTEYGRYSIWSGTLKFMYFGKFPH